MITAWMIILFIGGFTYLFFLLRVIRGLGSLNFQARKLILKEKNEDKKPLPHITVVIAARNEEANIGETIKALQAQDYPAELMEIIVVNDRSEDRTAVIVSQAALTDSRITLLKKNNVKPGTSPKKQALEKGIRSAKSDIIFTTDADCQPLPGWLSTLVQHFDKGVVMVTGQARFSIGSKPPLWQAMQELDYQSQNLVAAGLVGNKMPFSCTGASLAFRRDMFEAVGGYSGVDQLISGDDELLLAKAADAGVIVAATGADCVVPTKAVESLSELWQQRVRWGSKGLYYQFGKKIVLIGLFLFLVGLTTGPLMFFLNGPWECWIIGGLMKFFLDYTVFFKGTKLFDETFPFGVFILTQIIYAPVIVMLVIAGNFSTFEWKGQVFRSRGDDK